MDSTKPSWNPAIFNTFAFKGGVYLTKEQADKLYLSLAAGKNLGLIDGITPGIAQASRALIFDSNISCTGITNLQSSTIDCDGLNINNSTDLNLYGTTNSIRMHSSTSSTILMSGSVFNSITMQASSGFILLSGANQYVYLSGSSNYIRIDNTSASSNSTSGTIRTAGGIYVGNDSIFNTQISIGGSVLNSTNAGYLTSISPGTGAASKALVLDVNRDIANIRNLTTTVSLNSPQLTISGNVSNSISVTNTLSTGNANLKFINDLGKAFEVGVRGSASSPNSNFYIYDNTNSSYRLQIDQSGNLTWNLTQSTISGTMILSNTTEATSISTASVILSGGLAVTKNYYTSSGKILIGNTDTTCKLNITATGNHINLVNTLSGTTPNSYTNLGVTMTGDLNITLYNSGVSNSTQLSSQGWLGLANIGAPRYTIDCGTIDQDIKLCLKQLNNIAGTPTYGIGVKSGSVTISTGGGMQLWLSSNPGVLTTKILDVNSSLFQSLSTATQFPNNSWIGTPGYQNQISLASAGGLLVGTNTQSYTSNWLEVAASGSGHSALFKGGVVVGTTTSSSFPLYVGSTSTVSYIGSYGWLASSGAGSSSNFTNRSFSIYSEGGIFSATGEIDCASDIRLKKDIEDITEKQALTFIDNVTPISFKYKPTNRCQCEREHFGFSAQELAYLDLYQIVGYTDHDEEEIELEEQKVKCINGKTIIIPTNKKLTVSPIDIIPLLTKALQMSRDTIKETNKRVTANEETIERLLKTIKASAL